MRSRTRFLREMGDKLSLGRKRSRGRREDDGANDGEDSPSPCSSAIDVDIDEDVEDPPSQDSFDLACSVCYSSLGFSHRRVFETRTHAVRAVVMWCGVSRRVGVAFRGSKVGRNFATDAKFLRRRHEGMEARGKNGMERWWRAPMVHSGFYNAFVSSGIDVAVGDFVKCLVDDMRAEGGGDDVKVLTCGHSLGGALAQLCAHAIAQSCCLPPASISCYTFGCPGEELRERVWSATAVSNVLTSLRKNTKTPHRRARQPCIVPTHRVVRACHL